MANERITENLVRDILRNLKYYDDNNIQIEEQNSKELVKLVKVVVVHLNLLFQHLIPQIFLLFLSVKQIQKSMRVKIEINL